MKKVFVILSLILSSLSVLADDFVVDGIGYTVLSLEDKTVAVSSTTISNAVIPDYVDYKERTFTVTAINDLFDSKCKSTTLTVNSLVSELKGNTFYGSGLQNIYVNENNPYFTSVDGILYDKDVTRLISFPQKKYLPEYTMPSTVKTVDEYCMGANHYLTTIYFSDAIETLPKYVFYGCTYSNSNKCVVHLPENLKTLVKYSLSDLRIREICIPKNLTTIENGAMYFDLMEKVTCASSSTPNLCVSGTSTGFLYNCSKLTDLYVQDEVPSYLNEGTFKEGQFMSVTLHVPSTSLDLYKSAEGWKKFWTIVDENGNSTNITAEVQQYKEDYSYILSKTVETVTIEDKDQIDVALLAYSQLSEAAQAKLITEKQLLDALKQKVDELILLANSKVEAKQELASYKDRNDYREAQQVELANAIEEGNEAIDAATTIEGVNTALANAKSVIDAIKTDAQLSEEELFAEVEKFKSDNATILAKTVETVTADDKDDIENALLAYNQLSEAAQAKLITEKQLLDILKQSVEEIICGIDYITSDAAQTNTFSLSGLKVQTVQKGRVYIVNGKKILIK